MPTSACQAMSFQDMVMANEAAPERKQQQAVSGLRTELDILKAKQTLLDKHMRQRNLSGRPNSIFHRE
jgi:hypothetical protein